MQQIVVAEADGVLSLLLNRPEKMNALTDEMYGTLADAIEHAQANADIRVVTIRGAGELFTAGNDISEFRNADPSPGPSNVTRFIRAIALAAKPLLAGVHGRAIGIGTTMLLHCDYVLLAEGTVLTTPFVKLGLTPEAGSSLLLPNRIGHARAFAMLALGEPINAVEAVMSGLANSIVPCPDLEERLLDVARKLASQPRDALVATKALLRDDQDALARIDIEREEFGRRLASDEARAALADFAGQRSAPPNQ